MNNILDSELRVDKANDIPRSSYFYLYNSSKTQQLKFLHWRLDLYIIWYVKMATTVIPRIAHKMKQEKSTNKLVSNSISRLSFIEFIERDTLLLWC